VRSFFVAVREELVDAGATSGPVLGGVQIDVVVFERALESLDECVVDGPSYALHRDLDVCLE
jgi:hypothetical protein